MPDEPKVTRGDRHPLHLVLVRAWCDCGGEMVSTGMVLDSLPPQYPHKCRAFGAEANYWKSYPHQEFSTSE